MMDKPVRDKVVLFLATVVLSVVMLAVPVLAYGPLQWTQPVNVSHSLSESEVPTVVGGDDGQVHVIWEEEGVLVHSYIRPWIQ